MAESGQGGVAPVTAPPERRQRPPQGRVLSTTGANGAPIRYGHWQPEGEKRGTCLILQGRREFIEKYFETVNDLLARGFEVFTFDWRGQGKSIRLLENRQKGHIGKFDDYLADLDIFLKRVIGKEARPLYCLAHSMGGHLALRYAHDHPSTFQKIILTAPMVAIHFGAPEAIIRRVVGAACALGLSKRYAPYQHDYNDRTQVFEGNRLTSDPERFAEEAYFVGRDPLLAMGGVTFGWLKAALQSTSLLEEPGFAEEIATPILIAIAGADRVVSNERIKRFAKRLPAAHLVTIGDSRHEILRENDGIRAIFWRLADEFLGVSG